MMRLQRSLCLVHRFENIGESINDRFYGTRVVPSRDSNVHEATEADPLDLDIPAVEVGPFLRELGKIPEQ